MAKLSDIPYRIPLVNKQGLIDRNWAQFFEALLRRTGGAGDVAGNDDLETAVTADTPNENMALLTRLQKQLDDFQTLQLLGDGNAPSVPEADPAFDTPSPASLQAVTERIHNLEALDAFL